MLPMFGHKEEPRAKKSRDQYRKGKVGQKAIRYPQSLHFPHCDEVAEKDA